MIKVQVICADNLPVPTKNERKTKIMCYSSSSCNYFYDYYKNDENTRNPKWNVTFDVDLFRCSTLYFKLYSTRLFSSDIFLGEVNIDFTTFLNEPPGSEILKIPYGSVQCEFPLTSSNSPNATLSLSFLFTPKAYLPIEFKDISNPLLHVWATYTPSLQGNDNNIEIDLLQAYTIKQKKEKIGYFYNLNNSHSWESVGYSSGTRTFLGPTGYTPIRTFFFDRINGHLNFFIVNIHNYSGVVTLNFVVERRGKDCRDEDLFISPRKDKKPSIGTVKTVDIKVEANQKYIAPVYLHYEKKLIRSIFELNDFQQFSTQLISKSDFTDQICSEILFYGHFIEFARNEIDYLRDVSLKKTFILPSSEKVSLQKVYSEFGLQIRNKIRIYINGSTTHSTGNSSYTHFWKPFFKIFDLNGGHLCPELSKALLKKPAFHFRSLLFEKNTLPVDWHTYVTVDLDAIGIDKVVVFNIKSASTLESAQPPGILHITRVDDDDKETLLFRSPIYVESRNDYCGIFMRFEFAEDGWCVVPMRHCFNKKKKLDVAVQALYMNNWEIPDFLDDKLEDVSIQSSSDDDDDDDELLLDEIEAVK